jgi:hypothetical protein
MLIFYLSSAVFSEMRCAALRLPWLGRRCGGEVDRVTPGGCKGDISWSQDRYQPARNSILAAGSDPKRRVCEIPLSARSPRNLGQLPTADKAQHAASRVRLHAHSVATFCVATECRTARPAGNTTCRRGQRRHRRRAGRQTSIA